MSDMVSKYRPEIDGLRAFAVVAVIINHINKNIIPSGYLGVDIFFLISGFVITSSLFKKDSKNFFLFITSFYERRIKRLIPALVFFVFTISIILSLFVLSAGSYYITGVTSLFGFSNIYLFFLSDSYWGNDALMNPFTHTWSLGVEEQFYLIFPIIFWFTNNNKNKSIKKLSIILGFFSIISLFIFVYNYKSNNNLAYYLMPSRFWEIGLGSIAYLTSMSKYRFTYKLTNINPIILIIPIFLIFTLPISKGLEATISIVILTFLLLLNIKNNNKILYILSYKYIINIGKISYSLYLWHWGIIAIARWTIGVNRYSLLVIFLLIILMSFISYQFIEKPFREFKIVNRNRIFILGFLSTSFTSLVLFSFASFLKTSFYLGENKSSNPIENIKIDSRFYIIGDSHSNDLWNLLNNNGSYQLVRMTKPGCLFYKQNDDKCDHLENTMKILSNAKKGDYVLASSNYLPALLKKNDTTLPRDSNLFYNLNELSELTSYLDFFLPQFERRGINFILKLPHPTVNTPNVPNGLICKKEFFRPNINPQCLVKGTSKIEYDKSVEQLILILETYKNKYSKFIVLDLTDVLCPNSLCYPITRDKQYLRDSNHIFFSSGKLSDEIVEKLNISITSFK